MFCSGHSVAARPWVARTLARVEFVQGPTRACETAAAWTWAGATAPARARALGKGWAEASVLEWARLSARGRAHSWAREWELRWGGGLVRASVAASAGLKAEALGCGLAEELAGPWALEWLDASGLERAASLAAMSAQAWVQPTEARRKWLST